MALDISCHIGSHSLIHRCCVEQGKLISRHERNGGMQCTRGRGRRGQVTSTWCAERDRARSQLEGDASKDRIEN